MSDARTVFAHTVDDVRPRRMLFEHRIDCIDIVLQICVHADRHIRIWKNGHEAREQGILMSLVVREIDAGKERTLFRARRDQLPCAVAAAIVDKGDAALCAHLFRRNQRGHLLTQLFRRIGQNLLLVVAGHDEIEYGCRHSTSSLKIQRPSFSSTSCQCSAPSSFFIF